MVAGFSSHFRVLLAALLAFAFVALPGSARADVHHHDEAGITAGHDADVPPLHEEDAAHEHCTQPHGACHVPMVTPPAPGAVATGPARSSYLIRRVMDKPSGAPYTFERPPRA